MNRPAPTDSGKSFFLFLIAAALLTLAFSWWLRTGIVTRPHVTQQEGEPLPPIEAEGWINGPAPTPDDLRGKVVLVDIWAHWCAPCRADAPEMVALYEKYKDEGVVFVGLTSEGAASLRESQAFLKETGIPWPNGYGALKTLLDLNAEYIPTVVIAGRDGRIVWRTDPFSNETPEDGLRKALGLTK